MTQVVKKSAITIFLIGLLSLAIFSILGLIYLTQMAYSDDSMANGKYCGNISYTQRNIARLAIVSLWIQFFWVVLGVFLQSIWQG